MPNHSVKHLIPIEQRVELHSDKVLSAINEFQKGIETTIRENSASFSIKKELMELRYALLAYITGWGVGIVGICYFLTRGH